MTGKPKRQRPGVDQACVDLAKHFLDDVKGAREEDIRELAEELQRRCEDACREVEEDAANKRAIPLSSGGAS